MAGYGSGNYGARLFGLDGTVKDASAQISVSGAFTSAAFKTAAGSLSAPAVSSVLASAERIKQSSAQISATGQMATVGVKNASATISVSCQLAVITTVNVSGKPPQMFLPHRRQLPTLKKNSSSKLKSQLQANLQQADLKLL